MSIGLSVQEKFNIDVQDGGHPGSPIKTTLATFNLQVTWILPMKFRVKCSFGSGEKRSKYIFNMAARATILDI